MDQTDLLGSLVRFLENRKVPFCVIGGQAVNAYVEPLLSLDLEIAVALDDPHSLSQSLGEWFRVTEQPGSALRVQIQTDPRYAAFVPSSERRTVLGLAMPVAKLEDVLKGKVWAAMDPQRRGSKRQKDLADIARLLEAYPNLRPQVPESIRNKLIG